MRGLFSANRIMQALLVFISIVLLSGCPSPLSPNDSAQRNFDLEPPVEPSQSGAPMADPYDTTPQWTWTPSGEGADVFRVRINGGDWTLLPPSVHGGVYTYPNPAIDYYPGTYVFDVQERDASGNWSETTTMTTTIRVRQPLFTVYPASNVRTQNPAFEWESYAPAQFGAAGRYAFQLEREEIDEWVVMGDESQDDSTAVNYTVVSPLPEGRYRFGVAEWNDGGSRSGLTYTVFRVDLTPPGVPSVSGASIVSDSNPGPSVFTPAPNSGDTVSEYVWEVIDAGAVQVASGTAPAGGTISVPLSAGSGGPGVGNYQLLVAQTDLAGNTGTNAVYAVTVEEIPFLEYSGPNPVASNTPTFDVTGAASLTTFFDWVINGTPQSAPFDSGVTAGTAFTDTPPALADGTYTISIRQQRADSTYSAPANAISITVDTVAPPAPTLVSGPADPTNDNTPTFTFTGEAGADFEWSVSGATVESPVTVPDAGADGTETFALSALNDGTNTVSVVSVDAAGNISDSTAVTFVVDSLAPAGATFAGASPADGATLNAGDGNLVSYTWNFEAGATLNYNLTGPTAVSGSLPDAGSDGEETFTTPALDDGSYTMTVDVTDAAGNTSAQTVRTFTLDTVAPAAPTFGALPPSPGSQTVVSVTVAGELGGFFTYQVSGATTIEPQNLINGDNTEEESFSLTLAEGTSTLEVTQTDAGGNESASATTTLVVDTTAPPAGATFAGASPADGATLNAGDGNLVSYTWNFEAGATLNYNLTGPTAVSGSLPDAGSDGEETFTTPALDDGSYTMTVDVTDAAGNTSPQTVRIFTLDTVAPAAPTFGALPPSPGSQTVVSVTVAGELGGFFTYQVSGATTIEPQNLINGDNTEEESFSLTLAEGTSTLEVTQTDAGGNESASATTTLVVDTTAPPAVATVNAPDLDGTAPDQYTTVTTPTFTWTGSGEAGATWEYSTDGGTNWQGPVTVESVTLAALAFANDYQFQVREIDAAGNIGTVGLSIIFDVLSSGSSTITINNPGVPTFSMDTGPFTLDVAGNVGAQTQIISITTGETLDAQTWFINGTQVGTAATYTVDAGTDPALTAPLVYGTNTLTLVVEIGGLPYSDDFLFTVEDN